VLYNALESPGAQDVRECNKFLLMFMENDVCHSHLQEMLLIFSGIGYDHCYSVQIQVKKMNNKKRKKHIESADLSQGKPAEFLQLPLSCSDKNSWILIVIQNGSKIECSYIDIHCLKSFYKNLWTTSVIRKFIV